MFDVVGRINWLALLVATLACTALGGLWFAALFSKQYAAALGRDPAQKLKMTTLSYTGPMLCTLVVAMTSAILLEALKITSFKDALEFGGVVGIGYFVPTMINVAINPNFPRPLSYAAVNGPYFFLCSLTISSILVAFKQ
jgi:Protein of unknown function (DUF1761)